MDIQEEFDTKLTTLQKAMPELRSATFPDDEISKAITELFPECLIVITEHDGKSPNIQHRVSWHGFGFTVTRLI